MSSRIRMGVGTTAPTSAAGREAEIQELQGEELPIDQDAILDPDEIDGPRRPTLTELDTGAASAPDRELLVEADEDLFLTDADGLFDPSDGEWHHRAAAGCGVARRADGQ